MLHGVPSPNGDGWTPTPIAVAGGAEVGTGAEICRCRGLSGLSGRLFLSCLETHANGYGPKNMWLRGAELYHILPAVWMWYPMDL